MVHMYGSRTAKQLAEPGIIEATKQAEQAEREARYRRVASALGHARKRSIETAAKADRLIAELIRVADELSERLDDQHAAELAAIATARHADIGHAPSWPAPPNVGRALARAAWSAAYDYGVSLDLVRGLTGSRSFSRLPCDVVEIVTGVNR